ncbi:MAG: hypothetical protein R2867_20340 [Caldilineaceae bacterium]
MERRYYGRLTIMDWLNLPTGVFMLGDVVASSCHWVAKELERAVGGRDLKTEPKLRYVGAAGLVAVAVAVLVIGQPDTAQNGPGLKRPKPPCWLNAKCDRTR